MNRRHFSSHGFALLTVLLVVVLIGAIVGGVLSALRSQSISAIRGREESQARAIAESCADRMFAYSTSYIKDVAAGEAQPPADFDRLLDPNGIVDDDDDFLPPGTGVAAVPPGSTSRSHRYRVLRIDGGACLARFDDNSDDWHPGLGDRSTSNTGVIEGPAVGDEVPTRDRDRSIWVSVIGVFPAFDATPASDVWSRAHARVSIRRFLETAGGPAVWAGDTITVVSGQSAICGLGGMVSGTISNNETQVCACGHQKHDDTSNAIANECNYTDPTGAGDACDDRTRACEPNLREEASQPAPEGSELPMPTTFNALPRPLVENKTCAVWVRDKDAPEPFPKNAAETHYTHLDTPTTRPAGAEAFVWLPDGVRAGLVSGLTAALGVGGTACSTLLGSTLAVCGTGTSEVCAASPPSPMPPPCRYSADADGVLTLKECRGNESRCWLPVARLDGKNSITTSTAVTDTLTKNLLGPLVPSLSASGLLNKVLLGGMIGVGEHSVVVGAPGTIAHEYLSFQDKPATVEDIVNAVVDTIEDIPLVGIVLAAPVRLVLGLVTGLTGMLGINKLVDTGVLSPLAATLFAGDLRWSAMCGGGCENCEDAQLINVNGTSLTFGAGFVDQRNMPRGMTLIVENGGDVLNVPVAVGTVVAVDSGRAAARLAIRAQGDVNWSGKSFACCPTCTCPGDTIAGTVAPQSAPKRRATNGAFGVLGADCDSQAAALYLPDDSIAGLRSLLHADGSCRVNGASALIGRITCANTTIGSGGSNKPERDLGGCLIGGVDGRSMCGVDTPCPEPPPPPATTPASFNTCGGVSGCDDSGVCIEGSVTIVGNIRSATDVCLRRNTTVYGQVIAGDDVTLEQGIVVNHDNAGSIGAVTQAQAWLEAYP